MCGVKYTKKTGDFFEEILKSLTAMCENAMCGVYVEP